MDLLPFIEKFRRRFDEVEALLSSPDAFANPPTGLVSRGEAWIRAGTEITENKALLQSEGPDSELGALATEELQRLEPEHQRLTLRLLDGIAPPSPTDSRNSVVEIRAAAGGAEAALFADLCRMYSRYAEARGWKVETLDASTSDLGGLKEVVLLISGEDVFKRLKHESGVHRVQRVPATEAQGRIHTSTATVAVLPEAQEVDVEIKTEDLDISVCRAGGHGGQGVNTTDSAVRIVHKPSGLEVRCQDERSQHKNKAKAMMVLRSRLLERKLAEEAEKMARERRGQVGTGDRSEKIRTYNFPQNRVTDHRIEVTLYNLSAFVEGNCDPIFDPLIGREVQERLALLHN